MLIPSISMRFSYNEETMHTIINDPWAVVWKDIFCARPKVEKDLINLLERVSNKVYTKPKRKPQKPKANNKKRVYKKRKYKKRTKNEFPKKR